MVAAAGLTSYAAIDAAYIAGADVALTGSVPIGDFSLVASDLTASQVRTLIVAAISNGVNSYQVFQITFSPAVVN